MKKPVNNFFLSCLWFAYSAQWGALLAVVLPRQVELIVGQEQKYAFNGTIGFIGAFVALVVTPIAGALSDRSQNPKGRRRNYLLYGVLLNAFFLVCLANMTAGSGPWTLALLVMGVQFGCNWWGGPYAGLIPDNVPESDRGKASSWMAIMSAAGTILGAVGSGAILGESTDGFWKVYYLLAALLILFLVLTLTSIKESPRVSTPEPFSLLAFLKSFWVDPKIHRDFYWVLGTRAMVAMGLYSVFSFFQYFLGDIVGIQDAPAKAGLLVGIVTLAGMPAAIFSGPISDKIGRKPVIYLSGAVMFVATLLFIAVTKMPTLGLVYAAAAVFGLGYGAYQAVDWALAIDVLPSGENSAKDMGIWHVSMVLPQMIGPALTGRTLQMIKGDGNLALGYAIVFAITSVWFVLGTVLVSKVKTARSAVQ